MSRTEAISVLREMISGKLDLVVGCRRVVKMQNQVPMPDTEAWRTIVGIESETDDVPIAEERAGWDPESLKEKENEVRAYLDDVRPMLLNACRKVLEELEAS
jgi:hypothetical protein